MKILVHSQYEDDGLIYNHLTKTEHTDADYSPHFHDIFEVIFLKSGHVSYIVNGRKYHLRPNMLVFSRPADRHCIQPESTARYERYNILFDENILSFRIHEKIPPHINVVDFNANKAVIDLFDKMDFYCRKLSGENLRHILTNLTEELLMNITIETDSLTEYNYTQINPLVSRAIQYIDENLITLKSIEDVCSSLFITKSHLHHLFLRHLQITPKKYITAKRLALARRELYAGGKATEVCTKCGFSDYSAFFRAYKAHFGHCPSEVDSADILTDTRDFIRHYHT